MNHSISDSIAGKADSAIDRDDLTSFCQLDDVAGGKSLRESRRRKYPEAAAAH